MSKCRYCGKEYDGGGLWDDGFCCGRCRSLAKDRKISGKIPSGCLYIVLIGLAFFLIYGYLNPDVSKGEKRRSEKVRRDIEQKESKEGSKDKTADWQSAVEDNAEKETEEETETETEESAPEAVSIEETVSEVEPQKSEIDATEQTVSSDEDTEESASSEE